VLARLAAGARLSLGIAVAVLIVTASFGTALGVVAGWHGGIVDLLLVRMTDVFQAFPGILLAIALAGVLGPGPGNVVLALSVVGWVGFARLARAQTLSLRQRDHVQVARALGVAPLAIVARHVLPLLVGPLLIEATFACAAVIVAEAACPFSVSAYSRRHRPGQYDSRWHALSAGRAACGADAGTGACQRGGVDQSPRRSPARSLAAAARLRALRGRARYTGDPVRTLAKRKDRLCWAP